MEEEFKPRPNHHFYHSGMDLHKSLGSFTSRLPVPKLFISLTVDAVPLEVSFLLLLQLLDQSGMLLSTIQTVPCFPSMNWKVLVTRKLVDAYLTWQKTDSGLFKKSEQTKLHRECQYPADDKLLNLLKRLILKFLIKKPERL